jgi:hypothetical protein
VEIEGESTWQEAPPPVNRGGVSLERVFAYAISLLHLR